MWVPQYDEDSAKAMTRAITARCPGLVEAAISHERRTAHLPGLTPETTLVVVECLGRHPATGDHPSLRLQLWDTRKPYGDIMSSVISFHLYELPSRFAPMRSFLEGLHI